MNPSKKGNDSDSNDSETKEQPKNDDSDEETKVESSSS